MTCQPLCKLLGHELSYLDSDRKLRTSELAKDANCTIGLLFASEESLTKENEDEDDASSSSSRAELRDLTESLLKLREELKKGNEDDDDASSFEVVLIAMNQNQALDIGSSCSKEFNSQNQPELKSSQNIRNFLPEKISLLQFLSIETDNAVIIQEYLMRKYEIQEFPSLVLINASTSQVICYNGKEKLMEDPKGTSFPWRSPSLEELFGNSVNLLQNSSSFEKDYEQSNYQDRGNESKSKDRMFATEIQPVFYDSLKAPIRALFFAAFWCPPCRTFLSSLTDLYQRINKNEKKFEIIFVSSDRSQESFNRFFASMPWLAVPFENTKLRDILTKKFNVKAIPNLTLLEENGKIITTEGRLEVNDDLEGIEFPWYRCLVEELRDRHCNILNSNLCMIYFTDNTEVDYEKGELILTPTATQIDNSNVPEALETKCFVAADSDLAESLRIFMDLDETKTYLVILNISNFRYAVQELNDESKCTVAFAKEFLQQFQENKLIYKYIQSRFV